MLPNPFDYPYPQNLIASITLEFNTMPSLPHDIDRAITYILDSLDDPQWADIILLRFKDHMSNREIAARYAITTSQVRKIIQTVLRKLRHPSRYIYIKYGYSGAVQHLAQREKQRLEEQATYEKALSAFHCDVEGVPLHSIKDELFRIAILMSRSEFISIWETNFTFRISSILHRAGNTHLWQVCFLTPEQVLALPDIGPKRLAAIQTELASLDLELDDGTLSDSPELRAFAEERFQLFQEAANISG